MKLKKLLAVLLSFVMISATIAVPVFADGEVSAEDAVAEVNGVYYSDLQDAFISGWCKFAWDETGETPPEPGTDAVKITILKDITLTNTVYYGYSTRGFIAQGNAQHSNPKSINTTLDLNGHTVSGSGTSGVIQLTNLEGLTLTVIDSSEAKTGKIANTSYSGPAIYINQNVGKVIWESGSAETNGACFNVQGKLEINGGTFTKKGDSSSNPLIEIGSYATLILNDGIFNAQNAKNPIIKLKSSGQGRYIVINGGEYNVAKGGMLIQNVTVTEMASYDGYIQSGIFGGAFLNVNPEEDISITPNTQRPFTVNEATYYEKTGYYVIGGCQEHKMVGNKCKYCGYSEATNVAKIGDDEYATLAEAFGEAEAGQTVKLIADVDISADGVSVATGKDFILDLNGHSIKTGEQLTNNIYVCGKLTLVDSAENSTGVIYTEEEYTSGANKGVIYVSGEFVMNSGKIEAVIESDPANKGQFGIDLYKNAKVTINGGEIKAGWYALATNGNNEGTEITINGGTLISTADYAIYNPAPESKLTVNGGTMYGDAGSIAMYQGTLDVKGGIITSKGIGSTGTWGDGTGGLDNAAIYVGTNKVGYGDVTATISGGMISAEGNAVVLDSSSSAYKVSLTVTGGYFSSDVSAYVAYGYECIENRDDNKNVYPYKVVREPEVEVKVDEENTVVKDENGETVGISEADKTAIKESIEENDAVNSFGNTGIEKVVESITAENPDAVKELLKAATNDGDVKTAIESTMDIENKVVINLTSVVKKSVSEKNLFTRVEYDVKPMVKTTVTVGGEQKTVEAKIPNDKIKQGIEFRLAADKETPKGTIVKKFHGNDFIGNGVVEEENGNKFVRFVGTSFSTYGFEVTDKIDWSYNYDSGKYDGGTKGVVRFLFDSALDNEDVEMSRVVFYAENAMPETESVYSKQSESGYGAFSADLYNLDTQPKTVYAAGCVKVNGDWIWSDVVWYEFDFAKNLTDYSPEN